MSPPQLRFLAPQSSPFCPQQLWDKMSLMCDVRASWRHSTSAAQIFCLSFPAVCSP